MMLLQLSSDRWVLLVDLAEPLRSKAVLQYPNFERYLTICMALLAHFLTQDEVSQEFFETHEEMSRELCVRLGLDVNDKMTPEAFSDFINTLNLDDLDDS